MAKDGLPPEQLIAFLLSLPGFGPGCYWRLRAANLPLEQLLAQPLGSLLPFIPEPGRGDFCAFYRDRQQSVPWQRLQAQWQSLQARGVTLLSHEDLRYPELLAEIHQPPPLLYVQGPVAALSAPQVAFVGSRRASINGQRTAARFARYLAEAGLAVTSGLAQGIDSQAHRGALAGQGLTVAVMGTGIDRVYPARHRQLAQEIVAGGGALVSELPPGTAPLAANFPRRNRIISGLSLGVVVVEAAERSGSLITARCALEQNREVFAIPGSIHDPLSRGCHQLLRDGATLVETALDIARELSGWCRPLPLAASAVVADTAGTEEAAALAQPAQCVLSALGHAACTVDELADRCQLPVAQLLSCLSSLELAGEVAREGSQVVRLV